MGLTLSSHIDLTCSSVAEAIPRFGMPGYWSNGRMKKMNTRQTLEVTPQYQCSPSNEVIACGVSGGLKWYLSNGMESTQSTLIEYQLEKEHHNAWIRDVPEVWEEWLVCGILQGTKSCCKIYFVRNTAWNDFFILEQPGGPRGYEKHPGSERRNNKHLYGGL